MQTKTNRQNRTFSHVSQKRNYSNVKPQKGRFQGGRLKRSGKNHFSQNRRSGGRKLPTFDPSQFINTNPVEIEEVVFSPIHTFLTFGLDPRVSNAVLNVGIKIPSPIQDKIIPLMLQGNDVIGLAETGTGKTAAFLLPLIHKTLKNNWRQTLILTPTRELALQIDTELKKLTRGMKIFSTVCVGGTGIGPQIKGLRMRNHFVIGTPGRILDLIHRKNFKTQDVTTVVLDEADRMLDMGFIHDIRTILKSTPRDRETHFFSATIDKNTRDLVDEFLHNPKTVSVKKKDVTNSIEQDVVRHNANNKFDTLITLLNKEEFKRIMIFGAMKHKVQKLADELTAKGIKAEAIHGNKTHGQRQRALSSFKTGKVRVLVATDVAARGIHVDDVSHVINYDLPGTFEDYVHRIGRTGRSDKKGKALTFVIQ